MLCRVSGIVQYPIKRLRIFYVMLCARLNEYYFCVIVFTISSTVVLTRVKNHEPMKEFEVMLFLSNGKNDISQIIPKFQTLFTYARFSLAGGAN
tara:strand:+ start:1034 stop:1315 length:282 start_codon:yes stop_codon:yes gene_type:complete